MHDTSLWGMALVCGLIVLGSLCAVIASLERILGRPIPRFRYSRPVRKNRVFVAVPVSMAVVFSVILSLMLPARCYHCSDAQWIMQSSGVAIGFSGIVGWLVFAVLLAGGSRKAASLPPGGSQIQGDS